MEHQRPTRTGLDASMAHQSKATWPGMLPLAYTRRYCFHTMFLGDSQPLLRKRIHCSHGEKFLRQQIFGVAKNKNRKLKIWEMKKYGKWKIWEIYFRVKFVFWGCANMWHQIYFNRNLILEVMWIEHEKDFAVWETCGMKYRYNDYFLKGGRRL